MSPKEIQDHKFAVAAVFAFNPDNVLWKGHPVESLCYLHSGPLDYTIKPQPAIAPGNNPHGLTVEHVGEGFRLLDADEIKNRDATQHLSMWCSHSCLWVLAPAQGSNLCHAYRTKLSREQLALLDKGEGWIPWFGEGDVPTGMVDAVLRSGVMITRDSEWFESAGAYNSWTTDYQSRIIAYRPVKQPEYVPWNRSTCPPLPFEVRNKENGNRHSIVAANGNNVCLAGDTWRSFQYIFANYTLTDGSPCGTKGDA